MINHYEIMIMESKRVFSWLHCLSCIQWNVGLGRLCHSLSESYPHTHGSYPRPFTNSVLRTCFLVRKAKSWSFSEFFVGKIIDWSKNEHFCTAFLNQCTHQVEFMNSPTHQCFLLPRIKHEYLDLATKLLFSFTLKWWMDVPLAVVVHYKAYGIPFSGRNSNYRPIAFNCHHSYRKEAYPPGN